MNSKKSSDKMQKFWRGNLTIFGNSKFAIGSVLHSAKLPVFRFLRDISWIFIVSRVTLYIPKNTRRRSKGFSFKRINFQDGLLSKLATTEYRYTKFSLHFNFTQCKVLFLRIFFFFFFFLFLFLLTLMYPLQNY